MKNDYTAVECSLMVYRHWLGWKSKTIRKLTTVFLKAVVDHSGFDMKYSFISMENLYHYWLEQSKVTPKYVKAVDFWSDYTDYITDCTSLKYDLNNTCVSKPKSLEKAHQNTIALLKMKEFEPYDPAVKAVYDSLKGLVEYCGTDYVVKLAATTEEVCNEGAVLNHCVSRYCKRIAAGEVVIAFVRSVNAPDTPLYTMALNPDMRKCHIVQIRDCHNDDMSVKLKEFLSEYKRWFNKRSLNGWEPGTQTCVYYKSVHKVDGKYISNANSKFEYVIGATLEEQADINPDNVHVPGIHMASLSFAQRFGDSWNDVAILELEVNIHDVIIPDADDQVRATKCKVLREVPLWQLGDWGKARIKQAA